MHRLLSLTGRIAAVALASCLVILPASAQIIQADFNESLDLPDFSNGGPRLLQNLNVALPSAGPHLTEANEIANPSGWGDSLIVSFDATTNILSLTGTGNNTYQLISVSMSNLQFAIPGQQITSIIPISVGNAASGTNLTVGTLFTANSFTVDYSVPLGTFDTFTISPTTDTFQVTFASGAAAPEPGTLALLGAGLGTVGLVTRRRKR